MFADILLIYIHTSVYNSYVQLIGGRLFKMMGSIKIINEATIPGLPAKLSNINGNIIKKILLVDCNELYK
jgi:hypothetical protein